MSDATAPIAPRAPATSSPQGQLVGRFVLLSRLGEGGSGEVFQAFDPVLDRRVAIKLLHAGGRDQAALVDEGRLLARLAHPAVVAVHDAGTHGDRAFLAMELVDGEELGDWAARQAKRGDWRSVLEAIVEAGTGLAAAHAQDVVHGDVKPSNVLVGSDGRARVSDFGIARHASRGISIAEDEPTEDDDGATTVRVRHYAGTPAYMAPEQHAGNPADASSDQYAFCLMAWALLSGAHPYASIAARSSEAGTDDGSRSADVLATRTPTSSVPLPRWIELADAQEKWSPKWAGRPRLPRRVTAALERGLARDPAQRWRSMHNLLEALRVDHAAGRKRIAWAVGGGSLLVATVAIASWERTPDRCQGGADQIAEVWNDDVAAQVEASLTASDTAFATDTWTRLRPRLQQYADEWATMHRDACEATTARGEQSPRVMDLRMACLGRAREELGAALGMLAGADITTVRNAFRIVDGVRPLQHCAEAERLLAEVPPPKSEGDRRRVEDVRRDIADGRARIHAGRYADALEHLEATGKSIADLDYAPVHNELAVARGLAFKNLGKVEEAETTLAGALPAALHESQWALAAEAARHLMDVVGHTRSRHAEGSAYAHTALGLTARDDADVDARAEALNVAAMVEQRAARYEQAEAYYREAMALRSEHRGKGDASAATFRANLGNLLRVMSRVEEAEALIREALQLQEAALGPAHPDVALTRTQLAKVFQGRGDYDAAEAEYRRALEIRSTALGPTHPEVGLTQLVFATLYVDLQQYADAEPLLEGAIEKLVAAYGEQHSDVATAYNTLAIAADRQGRGDDAERHMRNALSIETALLGPEHPEVATLHDNLGAILIGAKRLPQAEVEMRRALEIRRATLGANNHAVAMSHHNLGANLHYQGKYEDAEAQLRTAVKIWESLHPADHPDVLGGRLTLGTVLARQGKQAEALPHFEAVWAARDNPERPSASQANVAFQLAETLVATGGDAARAVELAQWARKQYSVSGDRWQPQIDRIDTWLAKQRQ